MTAWREMDRAQKWAFGLRFMSLILLLTALRYYLLFADPSFGLPRLEFLPSPFEEYAAYISLGLLNLSILSGVAFGRIQRKKFLARIWKEYEDEKAEDERRFR